MAIVMRGVVGDFQVREADEADDENPEQGRKAELEGARSR